MHMPLFRPGPSRRQQLMTLLLLAAVILPYGARVDEFILTRSVAMVRVLDLQGIPRDCPSGLHRWSLRAVLGSNRLLRRCGAIRTDHGRLRVLPSGSLLPFTMSREAIIATLHAGGCYEIRWFGYEEDPGQDAPLRTGRQRTVNTIYHAAPADDDACAPLPLPPSFLEPMQVSPGTWDESPAGLRVRLRVDLGGTSNAVLGMGEARDGPVLHLPLATSPQDGRRNEALLDFLADRLDLPRSSLHLASGETARLKVVLLQGDPEDLAARLEALAGSGPATP